MRLRVLTSERGLRSQSVGALGALIGLLVVLPACSTPGNTVELSFKGKCMSSKGGGVPAFSLLVARVPSSMQPRAASVTTKNGQYETRIAIEAPKAASGKLLGLREEKVTIQVSASGYKSKTFNVTAEQLFVGEPNTLNVTLEPSS